jgi:hypothetical protein
MGVSSSTSVWLFWKVRHSVLITCCNCTAWWEGQPLYFVRISGVGMSWYRKLQWDGKSKEIIEIHKCVKTDWLCTRCVPTVVIIAYLWGEALSIQVEVILSLSTPCRHTWGVEVWVHWFLVSVLCGGEWLISHLHCFTLGKDTWCWLNRRQGVPLRCCQEVIERFQMTWRQSHPPC